MKFVRSIGSGGFGNVDEVISPDGIPLARKTFSVNQPLDSFMIENVKKRFSQEVNIQSAINNPNIVPIILSNLLDDPPTYYMPLAINTLDDDLRENRSLNGHFLSVLSDIASALECMHAMQIFHRDLKPQNVLRFQKEVGQYFYAVSDFGLVSMHESRLSRLTVTGMGKGSDYYTAPEITQDLRNASVQSDVFSFGCILHDMVGTESRVPCAEINEPGPYSAILRGCTRRHPGNRFKTIRSVLDAIASVSSEAASSLSSASMDFIEKLESSAVTESSFWESILYYLDTESENNDKKSIYLKMNEANITESFKVNHISANKIGVLFSEWVEGGTFSFDYCDVISNKLEVFFNFGDFTTKSSVLMALLSMGTSHNRWYVERMFVRFCCVGMDANLAARFAIELRIKGKEVCKMFSHLNQSIGVGNESFHPKISEVLTTVCL